MTGRLALDFIGHSALVIELDGVRLLTDPVTRARVGPLRRVEPVPARDRLRDIDAVLISHLHWDHLDVPSLRDLGRGTADRRPGRGRRVDARGRVHATCARCRSGDTVDVGSVVVRAVPAVHSGFRPPLGPTAPPLGYVVRGSRSVYFAGRHGPVRRDGDSCGEPIDMALIPVWGWGPTLGRGLHLDPLRAAQALRLIRPRAAVPIHWGTYWPHALGRVFPERLVEPPAAFVEYAAELAPDVQTVPTAVGDVVEWEP